MGILGRKGTVVVSVVVAAVAFQCRRAIFRWLFFEVLFADYDGSGYRAIRTQRTRSRWETARRYELLENEVLVATWPRSGTHLTAMMVLQLLSNGTAKDFVHLHAVVPMLEFDLGPKAPVLEDQGRRRVLMTHEAAHSLRDFRGKVIFVYREATATARSLATWIRSEVGDIAPTTDEHLRSNRYLASRGHGYCEWHAAWWARSQRQKGHVLPLNYDAIIRDKRNATQTIANFLEIPLDDALLDTIETLTSYDYMVTRNDHRFNPSDWDLSGRLEPPQKPRPPKYPSVTHPRPDPATVDAFNAFCRPILQNLTGFPVDEVLLGSSSRR